MTLYGTGDVDGAATRALWLEVTEEFLDWAVEGRLGPTVLCNHIPPVLFLVAVPAGSESFLQMDASDGRLWRRSRLFEVPTFAGLPRWTRSGSADADPARRGC